LLINILQARTINHFFGGLVITPEGDTLQDEILEVIHGLNNDLPAIQQGVQVVESVFEKWRSGMNYKAKTR
jgi:hypothetical protein